jgi:hypothetical protein
MKKDLKALSDIYSNIIVEKTGRKVIKGYVNLEGLIITKIPEWLADVEIIGSLNLSQNYLYDLENCPQIITGEFRCSYSELVSLKGGPVEVGDDFDVSFNSLTSFEYAPKKVGGHFMIGYQERGGEPQYTREEREAVRATTEVGGKVI